MTKDWIPGVGALLLLIIGSAASPAVRRPAAPADPAGGGAGGSSGLRLETPPAWFVELSSAPLAEANPVNVTKYLAKLRQEKQAFRLEAAGAGIALRERYAYDHLWNGLSVEVAPEDLSGLSRLPGVVNLYPVEEIALPGSPVPVDPGSSLQEPFTDITMTGADVLQEEGIDGSGVTVATIDTGIDYLHPDLGGGFGPGFRVAGGLDLVGNAYLGPGTIPIPDPDPRDCNGHGTHVAGIIGANGGVVGMAPGVTFRAYKVFGCAGSTGSDVILAAMEMALADGSQVVNLSLGSPYQWPRYPTARAGDNLVNHGVVVVAAAGNDGDTGLYSMAAPAVGAKVIGTASVDNVTIHTLAFQVLGGPLVGYLPVANAQPIPRSGSSLVKPVGHGCSTDQALFVGLQGKTALAESGRCTILEKVLNVRNAGAAAVLVYNDQPGIFFGSIDAPPVLPAATLSRDDGVALAARARFPTTLLWTDGFTDVSTGTGGLVSPFSAYGDTPDLDLKPDLAAPGAFIFSTLPLSQGGYGLMSGTSMSSPHAAGAAALLIQARPRVSSQIVRDLLQNGAAPSPWRNDPSGGSLEPVHHQGAGLINIAATVHAEVSVLPGKLSLGAMDGQSVTRTLEVANTGASPATLGVSSLPALATLPDASGVHAVPGAAGVSFDTTVLSVPPGGQATLNATITEPADLPEGGLFGGYLILSPSGGGRPIRVPYSGVKGDYQSLNVLNQDATPYGNPLLSPTPDFSTNDPITLNPGMGEAAFVIFHLARPVRKLRMEVFALPTGRSYGRLIELDYFPRNRTPDSFFFLPWTGRDSDNTPVPAGTYSIRFSVEKPLGQDDNPADWEVWISPGITIVR